MRQAAAVAFLLCAAAWPAAAQEVSTPGSAPFWQRLREPETARAQALLRQGRAQLVPALRISALLGQQASAHRRVAVEGALARFERARKLLPNEPELLFLTGRALAAWEHELDGKLQQRNQEAIDCLLTLRRVDPWYEAEAVAFELGILFTREARFAEAAAEYRRAQTMQLDGAAHSATLGNLAEVTMLSGDLERAVQLYERATRESSGSNRLLSLWGWAVALDRLGEHGEALSVAQRAIRDDQAPMHVLEQGSVFFVPPHERHYYEGLGALALAQLAASDMGARVVAPIELDLQTLSSEPLGKLQHATGDALGLGVDPLLAPLHGLLLDELARRRPLVGPGRKATTNELSARVLSHLLEALGSFAHYLRAAGETGPWAADAQSHIVRLSGLIQRSQLRSHAKQQALHRLP